MPGLVLDRAPFTLRLRDVLRTVGGLSGEIGRPPPAVPPAVAPTLPYFIEDSIDGGIFDGPPLHWPDSTGSFIIQFRCVGSTGYQCESVADRIRHTLLDRNSGSSGYLNSLDVPASGTTDGLRVIRRENIGVGGLDADASLVSLPVRYEFGVTLL